VRGVVLRSRASRKQGRTNAAIAARLGIAEKSVVQHISRIYDDLGLEVNPVDHRRVMAVIRYLSW
jgi:DNA-binding NarL/FixJ family response regulator